MEPLAQARDLVGELRAPQSIGVGVAIVVSTTRRLDVAAPASQTASAPPTRPIVAVRFHFIESLGIVARGPEGLCYYSSCTLDRPIPRSIAAFPCRSSLSSPLDSPPSRFPGKPLADIDGRPMIEHVYRRAAASPAVSRVIVATDDLRIATRVADFGGNVRLTRADHLTGTDRLAEVASTLDCDIVVNVQGDVPLLDPRAISEAIAPFADPAISITTLYRRILDACRNCRTRTSSRS